MLIDTHAHIMLPEFDDDRDEIIHRAHEAGVMQIIAIGINVETSRLAIALAEQYDGVFATVGIHPCDIKEATSDDYEQIEALVAHPKVVAMGETGLDFYWDRSEIEQQISSFRWHIQMGRKYHLPVVVHDRDAHDMILDVLGEENASEAGVVLHCFTGDRVMAGKAIDAGYYISFGGIVTFKKTHLGEVVPHIPLDRLLVETDAPYLSPHPFRGRRNEPARVVHTAEMVARLRDISLDELAEATSLNAQSLFRLYA